jgi:predicted HTH domain antitoxin
MRNFTLNIPEHLDMKTLDFSSYIAAKLYEDGIVTAGQGAEIANLSKRAFIEILGKYNVSVFSVNVDDLNNDILNA